MKTYFKLGKIVFAVVFWSCVLSSCSDKTKEKQTDISIISGAKGASDKRSKKTLSEDFKKYWYAGEAEITSYTLEQARYGEMREGKAVLVYVTEPFLAEEQVKADGTHPNNIPVLKLNYTKNYLTGIYPYAVMGSSFYPVHDNQHAIKISLSVQEWCGHVYTQINNKDKFEITSHSYFENEADQKFTLEKTILENELWNKIRIEPKSLPVGSLQVIPSLEYIRLAHKKLKDYTVTATLDNIGAISVYTLRYPELDRTLAISFSSEFPYEIESWEETFVDGFGSKAQKLTTTGKKIRTIKSAYWEKNSNGDVFLRDSLSL